jgi:hypothetical protein
MDDDIISYLELLLLRCTDSLMFCFCCRRLWLQAAAASVLPPPRALALLRAQTGSAPACAVLCAVRVLKATSAVLPACLPLACRGIRQRVPG